MDHILYQIFKITLNISLKKLEILTNNPSIMIYINKIENRITFEVKAAYYLELLTPKTMKLLESTKSEITKYENAENSPHIEITEVVLTHCNIVNSNYQQGSIF